jgi:hypothetical protein
LLFAVFCSSQDFGCCRFRISLRSLLTEAWPACFAPEISWFDFLAKVFLAVSPVSSALDFQSPHPGSAQIGVGIPVCVLISRLSFRRAAKDFSVLLSASLSFSRAAVRVSAQCQERAALDPVAPRVSTGLVPVFSAGPVPVFYARAGMLLSQASAVSRSKSSLRRRFSFRFPFVPLVLSVDACASCSRFAGSIWFSCGSLFDLIFPLTVILPQDSATGQGFPLPQGFSSFCSAQRS